ncbi:MAG: serine/threonine-protein phosphatase [Magnetococcales bacterium]|nr:serine/threonine-protein phosphatase [Magnetococcales bacterium]MBF0148502.1 serine/threonine-protein phosphatase [Magnetococcales bacterium]MBF0173934.1 serine/threonine-protein phosphatase [Magnetococcales bacterium]MBF0347416.1 serine/threonine-protein phosphatase [Magnetococcales bacterium]MBF0630652.1 serine/threonine-protein phosphatase [Magnetococcales bacterium]
MTQLIGGRLAVMGQTDVGCVRTLNEDCFSIDHRVGLLLVADGMGGHEAGEVASARVIELVRESLALTLASPPQPRTGTIPQEPPDHDADEPTLDELPNPVYHMVRNAINTANTEVNLVNQDKGFENGTGMGTTVVGLWLPQFSDIPVVFHVGDSRLYLYRNHKLLQITRDHSMYQQWLSMGKKGPRPSQNILLQAIGPARNLTPDIRFQEMVQGDIILLCSDGLYGMVSQEKIAATLAKVNVSNLETIASELIRMAKEAGGKDNITLIVGIFTR